MTQPFGDPAESVWFSLRARRETVRNRAGARISAILIIGLTSTFVGIGCNQRIAENGKSRELINSGIKGHVLIGPGMVHAKGTQDKDMPYRAYITIAAPAGRPVARVLTNDDGTFRIALRPGTYTVIPEAPFPDRPFPYAQKQTVTISSGQFVSITIHYDTGIR